MMTFEDCKRERDWIDAQITYMEREVDYYSGKRHYESELAIAREAVTQLRVKRAIAEAAVQTYGEF